MSKYKLELTEVLCMKYLNCKISIQEMKQGELKYRDECMQHGRKMCVLEMDRDNGQI
jgi:hypothetical protein